MNPALGRKKNTRKEPYVPQDQYKETVRPPPNSQGLQQPVEPMNVDKRPRGPKRPRAHNRIDDLETYDILGDVITQTSRATLGQLLKEPTIERRLRAGLVRPYVKNSEQNNAWLHSVETTNNNTPISKNTQQENNSRILAVKSKIGINGRELGAIIDTGAATSIISKKLQEDLGIEIEEGSKIIFTIANGKTIPSLGKVNVYLEIGQERIPTKMEVLESSKKELILGTDLFVKLKGKIDLESKIATIKFEDREIQLPIHYTQKELKEKEIESDEESIGDEFEQEYEEMEELELYGEMFEEDDEDLIEL